MKKSFLMIFALAAIAAGCTQTEPQEPVEGGITVLEATLGEDPSEARTAIGEKTGNTYPVIWTEGDCISVNGCPSLPLTATSIGSTGKTATFEVEGLVSAPYKGVYPLSAVSSYANDTYEVTLPQVQEYTAGSFDPAAAVMLSYGNGSLAFQNVLAYLKIQVAEGSDPATIRMLKLSAGNGEALSGTFTASFGETCSLVTTTSGSGVTLDCGDGVALGTDIVIAIPARTYASGFIITVITTQNKYQQVASSASFTAEAGKIYSTSFTYAEGGDYSTGIWTEEDLIAFLAAADGGKAGSYNHAQVDKTTAEFGDYSKWVDTDGKVHLKADITLNQPVDWSSNVNNRKNCVTNFDGHFDGEGHTITIAPGTTWRTPIFINVWGTIENLTIAGEMHANHAPELCSALVHSLQEGALLENCTNRADITYDTADQSSWKNLLAGGLVTFTNKATVRGCTNYGTLNIGGKVATFARVGGVAAYSDYESLITDCTNYGELITSIYSFEGKRIAEVGGVVGYAAHDGTVTNCYNRASALATGSAKEVGGVISSARSNVSGLHNYCPITQEEENDSTTVGGVINFIGSGYTLSNSTNNATLTAGGAKEIGGVVFGVYGTATGCVNNGTIYTSQRKTVVGGVAREVQPAGVLENCSNTADFLVMSAYLAGVVAKNLGTVTNCSNSGNIEFGTTKCRAAGIAYDNQKTMTDCVNTGTITCDQTFCNMAGIACKNSYVTASGVNTYATMTNCDNSGAITVTGENSRVGGVCFNMCGGTLTGCDNSGAIQLNISPVLNSGANGTVEFAGGVVGIVSHRDLSITDVNNIFATAKDGRYSPVTTYADNIFDAMVTIENCTNTGRIEIESTPSGGWLRNVAIGGIVGWNWAQSSDDYYLKVLNCTNGEENTDKAYLYFTQAGASAYSTPAVGGIIGWSGPYNTSKPSGNIYDCMPYIPSIAQSNSDLGYKVWIEGCESYGSIYNMASYSNSPSAPGFRVMRPCGGIAGVLYGNSTCHAVVKDCKSAAYVLMGTTGTGDNTWKQSMENVVGGIAGAAGFVDVDGCTVETSVKGKYGVGSETRYVLASGGIFGAAVEKFSIKNCNVKSKIGYMNRGIRTGSGTEEDPYVYNAYEYWGLAVGIVNVQNRSRGYTWITGSEIANNKFNPETVKVNGTIQTITADNFADCIISAADAADNATNHWLTLSGNTFGE